MVWEHEFQFSFKFITAHYLQQTTYHKMVYSDTVKNKLQMEINQKKQYLVVSRRQEHVSRQSFSEFSQTFMSVSITLIEKLRTCFLFLLENAATRKSKTTCYYFDYQNVNSLCSSHHYVNSSCQFCVSIGFQYN